jgi:hypothetical protein
MPTIEEIVDKYVQLRDRKAEISKRHVEELAPYNEGMENIEKWILNKMNEDGVQNYKTDAGTAYKATTTTVKMVDAKAFKEAIFAPAAERLISLLGVSGDMDALLGEVQNIILESALWDMVDFRAGKKGIQAHLEEKESLPPGVTVDSFTTLNIRRS